MDGKYARTLNGLGTDHKRILLVNATALRLADADACSIGAICQL